MGWNPFGFVVDAANHAEQLAQQVTVTIVREKAEAEQAFEALAKELKLHSVQPDAIPNGTPNQHDSSRKVYIGSHPIRGMLGLVWEARLSEEALRKMLQAGMTETSQPPDPTHHWAVCVGGYYHELNIDDKSHVVYQNGVPKQIEAWRWFDIGSTTFNDAAIKDAGKEAIRQIPVDYNLALNNCQNFVKKLLDLISPGDRRGLISSSDLADLLEKETRKLPGIGAI